MAAAPLRFGISSNVPHAGPTLVALARRLEDEGFDRLHTADHLGMPSPFGPLAAAAAVTTTLGLGTLVVNHDFWNPAVLAREAATLALVSDGRFELGVGAGHAAVEYQAAGIVYDRPGARIDRLAEAITVLRRLLDGDTVDFDGTHHRLSGAKTGIDLPTRVPLLVGGNGDRVLALAARYADTAGLVGFTSGTGQVHSDLSHFGWAGLEDRIAHVRSAAGDRADGPAFNVLVQKVVVGDRAAAVHAVADEFTMAPEAIDDSPFLLLGSVAEIAEQCARLHGLGITSIAAFEARGGLDLAPVISTLR